jgi:hypothetical protein
MYMLDSRVLHLGGEDSKVTSCQGIEVPLPNPLTFHLICRISAILSDSESILTAGHLFRLYPGARLCQFVTTLFDPVQLTAFLTYVWPHSRYPSGANSDDGYYGTRRK